MMRTAQHLSLRPALLLQRSRSLGLSVVELMIGITIGLFILAGASLVLTTQLGDNRRLLLEAQVQQDLRATADMMAHDIRAAGYWAHAYAQVWPDLTVPFPFNPYAAMAPRESADGVDTLTFSRSLNEVAFDDGTDDDKVTDNEVAGFRWNKSNRTIDVQLGSGNWQALTDPAVLTITNFNMVVTPVDLPLPCGATCPTGPGPAFCPLVLSARDVQYIISVEAVHDSSVKRSIGNRIRLRNEIPRVVCPAPAP